MRIHTLILSVSLLVVAMPVQAQRYGSVEIGVGGARRGVLAGIGPFRSAASRVSDTPTDAAVKFTTGQSELTVRARLLLDEMASLLLREPTLHAVIVRPTETDGLEGTLAGQRVDVIRAYLGARGVARYRVSVNARAATPLTAGTAPKPDQGDQLQLTLTSG